MKYPNITDNRTFTSNLAASIQTIGGICETMVLKARKQTLDVAIQQCCANNIPAPSVWLAESSIIAHSLLTARLSPAIFNLDQIQNN